MTVKLREIIWLCLVLAPCAFGANRFVTPSGAGSQNGTDWSNALASTFSPARGNVYYLADGSYGSRSWSTANSTTVVIEIRKCATTDGVSSGAAGYVSTLCDGQATFSGITFDSDYWLVNGVFRNESSWDTASAYGFSVTGSIDLFADATLRCGDNITVQYTHVNANTGPHAVKSSCFNGSQALNNQFKRNFLTNSQEFATAHMNNVDGCLFEYNYFGQSTGKEAIRGQIAFKNCIIRWNKFKNACGTHAPEACTADIALWDGSPGNFDNNQILGNWFWDTNGEGSTSSVVILVGGNGTSWAGSPANNTLVFNNTVVGMQGTVPNILVNGGSGNVCRNTLWYDNVGTPSANCNTASNNGEESIDPFVNSAAGDFHLSAALAGVSTGSPESNATDMDGVTRGGDGTFDRGAFEFGSSGTPPTITTTTPLPAGTVDAAYSQAVSATGDATITFSAISGALPTGLTLNSNGTISGTPTIAETGNFTVLATNSAGTDEQAFSITIAAAPSTPATNRWSGKAGLSGGGKLK